ncbi:hypothetical protein [Stenotrophomonas pavanii]|uniref:hypothetical protein n=1 Tax=Stenotrophomonas pavanii TaxID=487698 RepID=UPI0011302578|nr:hypothetical protein [Stenotrophomonas pavanii]
MNVTTPARVTGLSQASVVAGLLAAAAAVSIISRVPGSELLGFWQTLSVAGLCAAGLWYVLAPVARQLVVWQTNLGRRGRWLSIVLALLSGAIWLYALPVGPAPAGVADVTVSVLDGRNEHAQGREVWLRLERDGVDVPSADLKQTGDWLDKAPFLVAANPPDQASVHWHGSYTDSLRLVFISHAWSGRARVAWNGNHRDLDLYSAEGSSATVDLAGMVTTNSYLAFPERNGRQWFTAACDALLLGALTLFVFAWFAMRQCIEAEAMPHGARASLQRQTMMLAMPTVLTSLFALFIFYPGLMTSDSLDQWRQAGHFAFNDAHPLLYGLFIAAMRLVWDSPASAALVQMLLFSASCGWLLASLQRLTGTSNRVVWASAWLVALYPLLPITAVTLWKDVPYAAAVIALTAFLMTSLSHRNTQQISASGTVGLCLIMFCAMALRHNGPPVALAAALALFFLVRTSRLRVMLALIGAIVLMVLLKGPVSNAVGIDRKPVSYILYSHHIAAHLAANHPPKDAQDRALLQQLNHKQPDWAYNCATVNPVIFNPEFDAPRAMEHNDELLRIWLALATERPDIEYAHGLCSSGLIWRVIDSDIDPLYLASLGLWAPHGEVTWITGEAGDPLPKSKSPQLAEFIGQMVLMPSMQAVFRPALFMYALIFACGVAMFRRNDRSMALLLFLPAVHTAFLSISIVAQDARYQLPLYAITLAAVPLLLGARRVTTKHPISTDPHPGSA